MSPPIANSISSVSSKDGTLVNTSQLAVLILGTRSSRGALEHKESLLTTLSSYSLQHEMGRVFRGRVLCHGKSKRRQVEIGEPGAVVWSTFVC